MSDTGNTQARDTGIEEPEAFARAIYHETHFYHNFLAAADAVRARDEAVAAAARREVLEACCAAVRAEDLVFEEDESVCEADSAYNMAVGDCEQSLWRLAAARGWLREEAAEQGEEG